MTKYGFTLSSRLILMCLITAGLIALYGLCTIAFMIMNPAYTAETILPCVLAFGAAVCFAAIAFIEHRTDYVEIDNPNTPDPDSILIS